MRFYWNRISRQQTTVLMRLSTFQIYGTVYTFIDRIRRKQTDNAHNVYTHTHTHTANNCCRRYIYTPRQKWQRKWKQNYGFLSLSIWPSKLEFRFAHSGQRARLKIARDLQWAGRARGHLLGYLPRWRVKSKATQAIQIGIGVDFNKPFTVQYARACFVIASRCWHLQAMDLRMPQNHSRANRTEQKP